MGDNTIEPIYLPLEKGNFGRVRYKSGSGKFTAFRNATVLANEGRILTTPDIDSKVKLQGHPLINIIANVLVKMPRIDEPQESIAFNTRKGKALIMDPSDFARMDTLRVVGPKLSE